MQYIHIPNNIGIDTVGLRYNFGSNNEVPGLRGTSHLMEHLVFYTIQELFPQFNRFNIDHNAYTSDDRIVFYFTGLSEHVKRVSHEAISRILNHDFSWSEEKFESEKQVVLQEYGDVFNDQVSGFMSNIFRKHYGVCGPIGLRSDIESFSHQTSIQFRDNFLTPDVICETGSSEFSIFKCVHDKKRNLINTGKIPTPVFGSYDSELEVIPKEDRTIVGLLSSFPVPSSERNRISLLLNCLNDGLESPLCREIREKRGLSYFSIAHAVNINSHHIPIMFAQTENERAEELAEVYQEIFNKDISDLITPERFQICYDSAVSSVQMKDRIPFSKASSSVLADDPFVGLEDFTHEQAIELAKKYLSSEVLKPVQY